MEQNERQLVLDQLKVSRARLLGLVEPLTAEQWTFHPAEERWSIRDCLEHVMRVESRILGLIGKKLEEPPEPDKEDPAHAKDALISKSVPDRSLRREAPAAVRPTGEWADSSQLLAEFGKTRERTIEFAELTQSDLRSRFIPHMAFGDLDCYQWLLVLSLHSERHAGQIAEIQAHPSFPAVK